MASHQQLLASVAHLQAVNKQQLPFADELWEQSDHLRSLAFDIAFPSRRGAGHKTDNEVVVWTLGEGDGGTDDNTEERLDDDDDDDDDYCGDEDEDEEGSVEYLNLDGDEQQQQQSGDYSGDDSDDDDDQYNSITDPFLRGERIASKLLFRYGFINKRHAMFAAAGVIPDPKEVEMWEEEEATAERRRQIRAATPGATFLAASAALDVSSGTISTTITDDSSANYSSSPPRLRKRKPTLTLRSLLQILNGSAAELCEFEHGPIIVAQLPVAVLSRQATPLEALQQLWQVFSEAECQGRVSAACVVALDRIFVGVMTHQKMAHEFGNKCAALFMRMLCDVVAVRWQFLGGSDESDVVHALISSILSTPRVQMMDAVDPGAFLLSVSRWGGGHAAALVELRHIFQTKFASVAVDTFARLGKTSPHVAALRRIL